MIFSLLNLDFLIIFFLLEYAEECAGVSVVGNLIIKFDMDLKDDLSSGESTSRLSDSNSVGFFNP